ncbi:PP2C family protein-serine/threonine phosphatase [Actinomadura xylanilytica]|uniref:PP2C family protein-serine/threonine phosphatase n=1 Tax=Actinomadura xylanilytica TaxID=887459 RepID=UPI00255B3B30|nr:SpoIIE family protein phosphatase [Actinomadura xylanilytica]MDL4770669.1 SpoIIE family protein phosphatase [Actinomadura xylanilytica]
MTESRDTRPDPEPGTAPELADLRGAAHDRAMLAEARVVLAGRLGVPPGEALQHLIWLARDLDLDLGEAAALVVGVRGGESPVSAWDLTGAEAPAPSPVERAGAHLTNAEQAETPAAREILRQVTAVDTGGDADIIAALPADQVARAVLDGSSDSAAHLVPVRDDGGRVVDFLYAELNETARDLFGRGAAELTGLRLLRTDPGTALTGLFAAYTEVLETGRPYGREPFVFSTAQEGLARTSRMSARCVAVPTGVCVTWHYYHEEDRVRRRLERVERLAQIGFGEWDLVTGEAEWTPQMAANYLQDPSNKPPESDDLSKLVTDEDVPLVEEAFQTLFSRREPVEVEHRVTTPDGKRRNLWVFIEPVLGESGLPVSINVVSQDITRRRGVEQALAETRRQMLRQQARTAQERRVAVTLRRAILPDDREVEPLPGLGIEVRSLAAESAARIGGDWFATRALSDGRGLFAIGDAAGHGLQAAAAMARTRNGFLGLAYTGRPPGRLVAWLNELVGDLNAATGTCVVAHYDSSRRVLQWACAGHPPPILVRDGQAAQLSIDPDPLLGAVPGYDYATFTTRLLPGDLIFLYTDGLVERREADIDAQIERLTQILQDCADGPEPVLDQVLDRMEHDRAADDTTMFALRVH